MTAAEAAELLGPEARRAAAELAAAAPPLSPRTLAELAVILHPDPHRGHGEAHHPGRAA